MPGPAIAGIAGSVGSALLGRRAAGDAADAQRGAASAQIAETRRQFNLIQKLMRPYVNAGTAGLSAQLDLMGIGGTAAMTPQIEEYSIGGGSAPGTSETFGDWTGRAIDGLFGNGDIGRPAAGAQGPGQTGFRVNGRTFATRAEAEAYANANATAGVSAEDAQRAAIAKIANGQQFKALAKQGEYGLMANAAATGGLRGGDTQAALAQFRPQMLQSLIDRQLAQYGGLAANGQAAASGVGGQAMNTAGMINGALGDIGSANAGNSLAGGQSWQNAGAGILNTIGQMAQPTTPGGGMWQRFAF